MTIGERVKQLRCDLGMTQEELAKSIGYSSRSAINKMESGERRLNQTTISKLAVALHTAPSYLMGWEDEDESTEKEKSLSDEREAFIKKVIQMDKAVFDEINDIVDYVLKKHNDRQSKQD